MTKFIQVHYLTSYPASNLNRDDLGRPKTVIFGGKNRLRISSQCLKRTWRTSTEFSDKIFSNSKRTRKLCIDLYNKYNQVYQSNIGLLENNLQEIASFFNDPQKKAKPKKNMSLDEKLMLSALAYLSDSEIQYFENLLLENMNNGTLIKISNIKPRQIVEADIAMFGRMFANQSSLEIEAAVQVAHAFTVNESQIETDFFTAIDDMEKESKGSAHMGDKEFGSGLFYGYICIDFELLVKNLGDNLTLAKQAVEGIINAAAKVTPSGSRNSFANNSVACFVALELGTGQPRSFSQAFLNPVKNNLEIESISRISGLRKDLQNLYPEINNQYWESSFGTKTSVSTNIQQLLNQL